MNKDIKYIIKKVIIGILIAVILFSLKSCIVSASTIVTPDSYFKINNIESFPASLDNYATYSIEYAYPAGGIEYNYLILETCTQGNYEEFYIYSDACNNSCFEPGTITTLKTGTCTTNNSSGNKVIFQIRVKKTQLMADTLYKRVNNRIRFVGGGKTEIYSFYGSDSDIITDLAIAQENTQNIINQIIGGFSNSSSKQDAINDSVNDLNDTMNDSSTDSPNSGINAVKDGIATNGVITQLIILPVTLFQQILTSINGTCQSFNLGSLFGTEIILPCINVSNYLGATLWGIIDVIISGYFVWVISRKMISAFDMFSSMKDGDVLDD